MISSNTFWHNAAVTNAERLSMQGYKPFVLWYTGYSGSGKSTTANAVDRLLFNRGYHTYLLDGDNVRHGLNSDLGFDDASRVENIRRISEVSRLMLDAGLIVSTAFISPYVAGRAQARSLLGENFIEIFIDTPLAECEKRDPKGLYKKARAGEVVNFTGIESLYEPPVAPELHICTMELNVHEAAQKIIQYLEQQQKIVPLDIKKIKAS